MVRFSRSPGRGSRFCVAITATALALLERSLQIPAGITLSELRHDPTWDPLRSDPQFQRLIEKSGKHS